MIEVCAVGGYSEVGKNMTAVKIDDEVLIFDMGVFLPAIINYEEEGNDRSSLDRVGMINLGAVPDDSCIDDWKDKVKAILVGHCHLDHIAAIPYLADRYKAPIYGTPFTIEVIKQMLFDNNKKIRNPLKAVNINAKIKLSDKITVEFINITHSTLQATLIAVHCKYGTIMYANDFKFDNHPVLGNKPNLKRLRELGKENVILLVLDSLYADTEMKTPSEKVARELLRDVMLDTECRDSLIIVTTFASHLPRLKSVIDFSHVMRRKVVFLGRSMMKYITSAEKCKLVDFSKRAEIVAYSKHIVRKLKDIEKNRKKYVVVATGNQGEPDSVLNKMLDGRLPFKFEPADHVIFSTRVIPDPVNVANRNRMEEKLREKKVRIFTNIHVSVLPDTQVVINGNESMKIKNIGDIRQEEKMKVASFDPLDLKIKWFDARLIKHNYQGKIFRIKTKSGRSVGITSGHSVFKLNKGRLIDVSGDDLKIGDYLAIPKKFSWRKELKEIKIDEHIDFSKLRYSKDKTWIYYSKKKIIPRKMILNKEFARLLGYYLAEGSAPRHICLTMGSHEKEQIKEAVNSIKSIFPGKVYTINKGTSCEIQFGANIIKRIFKEWFGNNARTKRIPEFVFSTNDEFKLNFLGAYINGDGCFEDRAKGSRIRIKTASKKLASDLIYLFSQVGICAKFDHEEIQKDRYIAGNRNITKSTTSYVLRIQGKNPLQRLLPYLSLKYRENLKLRNSQTYPPEALPLSEIGIDHIIPKPDTDFGYNLRCIKMNKKVTQTYFNPEIIKRDSRVIEGFPKLILNGDLTFDTVIEIKESEYDGEVYDFEVPEVQNFIGGFGGIFLHNSGHAAREDHRDILKILKPKYVMPAHDGRKKQLFMKELAMEEGWKENRILLMEDGKKAKLDL